MKCPYCNAPLMIEDETCRYCGKENPYFTQHREDLKEFTEEFEETHQEVLEQVQKTSRRSANIVIVCVLIVLNLFVLIASANVWEFEYQYKRWYTNQHETEIRATLETYIAQEDIIGLIEYCHNYVDIYGTKLEDYYAVECAAQRYYYIYKDIIYLTILPEEGYDTAEELCASISTDLTYFYEEITPSEYDTRGMYSEEHMETMAMMQAKLETLIEAYLNIPAAEIPALLELSDARRAIAIEEGVLGNAS